MLVYVGAVMVLFLFVVMMLDVNFDTLRQHFRSYLPVGAAVGALVLFEMALVIIESAIGRTATEPAAPTGSNTKALGQLLYVDYVYPFEIAAVILLVAIIAAIALTHRERRETKHQDPGEQVKVRREDRVRLVDLPSENRRPENRQLHGLGAEAASQTAAARSPRRTGSDDVSLLNAPTLAHYLVLGAILFAISMAGIFLNRKNVIIMLMAIELMLLAVNLNFIAFSRYLGDMAGQVFVFFILTVAAAESAIGLAILVLLFRNVGSIDVEDLGKLKG